MSEQQRQNGDRMIQAIVVVVFVIAYLVIVL